MGSTNQHRNQALYSLNSKPFTNAYQGKPASQCTSKTDCPVRSNLYFSFFLPISLGAPRFYMETESLKILHCLQVIILHISQGIKKDLNTGRGQGKASLGQIQISVLVVIPEQGNDVS